MPRLALIASALAASVVCGYAAGLLEAQAQASSHTCATPGGACVTTPGPIGTYCVCLSKFGPIPGRRI